RQQSRRPPRDPAGSRRCRALARLARRIRRDRPGDHRRRIGRNMSSSAGSPPASLPASVMAEMKRPFAGYAARHFRWQASADGRVATITLDRPEKKNPLTFDSYAELRNLFRGLAAAEDVRAVVLTGAGGNFCSGGDVFEIIEPLTK